MRCELDGMFKCVGKTRIYLFKFSINIGLSRCTEANISQFAPPTSRMRFIDILPKEETLRAVFDMLSEPFRPHHLRGHANITIGSIEAAVYALV